jgi:hypothetical protein
VFKTNIVIHGITEQTNIVFGRTKNNSFSANSSLHATVGTGITGVVRRLQRGLGGSFGLTIAGCEVTAPRHATVGTGIKGVVSGLHHEKYRQKKAPPKRGLVDHHLISALASFRCLIIWVALKVTASAFSIFSIQTAKSFFSLVAMSATLRAPRSSSVIASSCSALLT